MVIGGAHDGEVTPPGLHQHELAADGFVVSLGTLQWVQRELGLRCMQQQRFRVQTTDSGHRLPVAGNVLKQDFEVARPGEVWTQPPV